MCVFLGVYTKIGLGKLFNAVIILVCLIYVFCDVYQYLNQQNPLCLPFRCLKLNMIVAVRPPDPSNRKNIQADIIQAIQGAPGSPTYLHSFLY